MTFPNANKPEPGAAVAKVVVNLSLDREFDYRIPERLRGRVRIGSRVFVPFGHGERIGYVVNVVATSTVPLLKDVIRIENEGEQIPENLVALARWIADYYCCAREVAVRALIPAVVRKGTLLRKVRRTAVLKPDLNLGEILPALEKKAKKRAAIVRELVRLGGRCEVQKLLHLVKAGAATLEGLAEKGLVTLEQENVDRDPFANDTVLPTVPLTLTADQARALEQVMTSMTAPKAQTILLHGVTGSGKTEVYLQAMAHCLEQGRDAIVLVPEIALTPQTMERFRGRFGETVSVLHSGLSDGERYDEWRRIRDGRARIVVGARSALFAPVGRLGLIVVDEEHETTYKQDEAPRYNARDVAVVRGSFENATVVLGSATPSLESAWNCRAGKYVMSVLPSRVDNQVMPVMEVIDMRSEAMQRGGPQIFSRRLETEIKETLERGEQVILFLNRRGYASQMLCTKCGYVAECPDCSTTYTYHKHRAELICHLCGRVLPAPKKCPGCGDEKIRFSGLGTEKIEAICGRLFPHASLGRMDSDTMTTKDAYRRTLNSFRAGRIQILIGTQMIAKGLHFPNVTLVGIIFADMGLHMPDFRAGERTFQLLVQVAGRAGRGEATGRVVVQTYTPFHMVLQHALRHDWPGFLEDELATRQALLLPPVTHMAVLHFRGENETKVADTALAFLEALRPVLPAGTDAIGPTPCTIAKVRGRFRYQISLRNVNMLRLGPILRPLLARQDRNEVEAYVDADPYSLM